VALALLIAIWGVFLGVALVRKRAEYRADSSIGAFQRQLQVLRRNSQASGRLPSSTTYEATLGAGGSAERDAALDGYSSEWHSAHMGRSQARYSDRPSGIDRRLGGRSERYGSPAEAAEGARYGSNVRFGSDPYAPQVPGEDRRVLAGESRKDRYFSREACERRRDVLLILGSLLVSTGLISIIPVARPALVLTAITGVVMIVYVALMVRLRAQATEREIKLRYIPQHQEVPVFADRRVIAR
jgi:hypothetical protein